MRRVWERLPVSVGPNSFQADVWRLDRDGVAYFFIDVPWLYDRGGLYGNATGDYGDNQVRFGALCQAAISVARHMFKTEVFHSHDWQAGLLPVYLKTKFDGDPTFFGVKTVLTIHNLGYQGIIARTDLRLLGLEDALFRPDLMEFYGNASLLKGGIVMADAITTVSRGYAREIQTPEYGFQLDGLLRARSEVLTGILNGVDYAQWSPETDRYLAANYSADHLAGKSACKRDLLAEFNLGEDAMNRPLIGIVSRFANQKGFDLIEQMAQDLLRENVTVIALGTGERQYEDMFRSLAHYFPGKVAVRVAYDNRIAHKIEAGADMFLMPSRYEPCGLNQIYSLRYGTVPVVRATGGLDDTIDEETGFKFQEYSGWALMDAVRQALACWQDRARWTEMVRRGMARDFSWDASAAEYSALYKQLLA
jgi:starch synthase